MSRNPYAPPGAEVDEVVPDAEVPAPILKKIRNAWVAGIISTVVTLVFTLLAIAGTSIAGITGWQLLDVVLMAGLSYGIYRKSRTCAVLMLVYFLVSKILQVVEGGKPSGIVLALVFFYYYAHGVAATFAYHKHLKLAR
jgi:hypothetical protein